MKVFKYKPVGENFERDIQTVVNNQFWSSTLEQLNDPCEALTDKTRINKLFKWIANLLNIYSIENMELINNNTRDVLNFNGKFGIFSLQKTHLDELLWGHYADSHKGYCLEYDLDKLIENDGENIFYSSTVKYRTKPPIQRVIGIVKNDIKHIIRKTAFNKPKRWAYEEEYRIATINHGLNSHDINALKAVYFGLRMRENDKNLIINRLKGKGIKYYQIMQIPNTYKFKSIETT